MNSPDLNPVDNMWSIGGTEVEKVVPIASKDERYEIFYAGGIWWVQCSRYSLLSEGGELVKLFFFGYNTET